MRKNIGNTEHRIICVLTDIYLNNSSVSLAHNTVNSKWNGNPLIFFYPAIIMRIQIGNAVFFINRILLCIKAW